MRLARSILVAVIGLLLGVYVFDCEAMTTPEQAMKCCGSMPCAPHGHHDQDCCKTMPTMHTPFVQPSAVQRASFSSITLAVVPPAIDAFDSTFLERTTSAISHAPPILSPPTVSPLRI
jgi:hypothetical protein